MEEQQQHSQNGAQLNDVAVHIHKLGGDIELDELVYQNEVSGGADGQPLGDALHHTQKEGFQQFQQQHSKTPFRSICQYMIGITG